MDIPNLISLVHQILHLIEREPLLSKRVFRVFGYSARHVNAFVENLKEELETIVNNFGTNANAANKEELINLIKAVYGAPFVREIKHASVKPEIRMLYDQLPNVSNTNVVPLNEDIERPEEGDTRRNKRVKHTRPTFTGEPYQVTHPSFANMPYPKKGGKRRRTRRKGSRLRRRR